MSSSQNKNEAHVVASSGGEGRRPTLDVAEAANAFASPPSKGGPTHWVNIHRSMIICTGNA